MCVPTTVPQVPPHHCCLLPCVKTSNYPILQYHGCSMLLRPNPAGEMLGAALSARQRVLQETSTASSPLQVSCPAPAPVLRGFPAKETPQHITGPAPCTLSFDLLSLPWCIRHKPCTCPAGPGRTGTRAGQEGRTSRSLGNVIKAALLGAPPAEGCRGAQSQAGLHLI